MSIQLSQLIEQHEGPVVVITEDANVLARLMDETRYFIKGQRNITEFPDWETLPYDQFSPHEDIVSTRIGLLAGLSHLKNDVIFIAANTLMQRLCPASHIHAHTFVLNQGDKLDMASFRAKLQASGYRCVSEVLSHGEFAVRGSIIDVFPMGQNHPFRLDLFDDEIDTIRTFDPETQRSAKAIDALSVRPAHEFSMDDEGITHFRQAWRATFSGDPMLCRMYEDVSEGIAPPGIEYYIPLFFDETATFFDYLPKNTLIIQVGHIPNRLETLTHDIAKRHEQYSHDVTRPLLPPQQVFLSHSEVLAQAKTFEQLTLRDLFDDTVQPLPELTLNSLKTYIDSQNEKIIITAESAGRRETLLTLLQQEGIVPHHVEDWNQAKSSSEKVLLSTAPLSKGFIDTQRNLIVITEFDILGGHVTQRRSQRSKGPSSDQLIKHLVELNIGDPVVHQDHGVGRYQGLVTLNAGGVDSEYLILTYANNDKIYVPVASLHLITRYSGIDKDSAPLNRLGSKQWNQSRKKALEQIKDTAAELLNVYARRKAKIGFAHKKPDEQYYLFANAFPFEETPDQHDAIEKVIEDMTSPNPMDRLVCGDVGFGKTEVAMRAAFLAVNSGKQVAVLVPTTLLAQQHYESFKDRFAEHPVNVQQLSRFRTDKAKKETIKQLSDGKVDIVIGTHALLSNLVEFKDLGLVIIDEEHRFGVTQKEKLKKLRTDVDILTLTATPIPRTLNLSMHGVRDLSIIATPPKRRLSIKTFVRENNSGTAREAILREVLRGGQVYYLHNKVETIEKTARNLQALVPEAKIQIAHGQMRERELERIMSDFYHQRFNVLVCTTIIETGIDIPTANTIIMDRADHLGLAQMHQLRGRVGRSHHQAYAYLFTPNFKLITKDAIKRLEAIESLEDLGAGFMLATHDLEIRGAGEILGEQQSGEIQSIGFSLYTELLERAVGALQSGKEPDLLSPVYQDTEIDLKVPALIPEAYLPDVHTRLVFYKRISSCKHPESLRELQVEMIDRFGLLPPPLKTLFQITELKLRAHEMGIQKIEANTHGGQFEFTEEPQINTQKLIALIQNQPKIYRLRDKSRLQFSGVFENTEERLTAVSNLLYELQPEPAA